MRRLCPHCQTRFAAGLRFCPDDGRPLRDDPFIGARIGRWTLVEFIGEGAMGVVYAAEPTAAIKILHARRAAMQPDLIRRFEIEAEAVTRLTGRHVARVYASGTTDDGHLYIAMELLRGAPLDQILARTPRLTAEVAATIGHQVALALDEAHGKAIVHRDLKPGNIFVEPTDDGGQRVRVLDFGVARINSDSVARSRTGTVAGTPAYMSPEQLRGETDIDGRSDIYALGVVLYQLLGGANPFRSEGGIVDTLRRHLEWTPPTLPDSVPPLLARVVMRMLAKDRGERPQSMGEVRFGLEVTGLVQPDTGEAQTLVEVAALGSTPPAPERRAAEPPPLPPSPSLPPDEPATEPRSGELALPSHLAAPPTLVDPDESAPGNGEVIARRRSPRAVLGGLAVLAAVALAAGLWLWHAADGPGDGIAADGIAADGIAADGIAATLAEGRSHLGAERWYEARGAFDRVLASRPEHAEALSRRAEAERGIAHRAQFDRLAEAVGASAWPEALDQLGRFPADGPYTARAEALRSRIQRGFAEHALRRGRARIAAGDLKAARQVARALARHPFAVAEAVTLDGELLAAEEAKRRENPPPPPPPAPTPTPTPEPRTFAQLNRAALDAMGRGDRDAAIRLLERASRMQPESDIPYQRLCAAYRGKGDYRAALGHCRKWLEREPNPSHRSAIERQIEDLERWIERR